MPTPGQIKEYQGVLKGKQAKEPKEHYEINIVRTCPVCDENFLSHSNRGKYCSLSCMNWWRKYKKKRPKRTCETCQKELPPRARKYCSKDCRPSHRPKGRRTTAPKSQRLREVKCAYCRKTFTTYKSLQKYCSLKCSKRGYHAHQPYENRLNRKCELCGKRIPDDCRPTQRFCSPSHQVMHNQHIRRARRRNLPNEDVSLGHVIERDGTTCHLCGKECDPSEMSLDHLIPLSVLDSPGHILANLGLAHRSCNSRKRNNVRPEDYERLMLNLIRG